MKSLLPGQLEKVLQEAVGSTHSESARGLGRDQGTKWETVFLAWGQGTEGLEAEAGLTRQASWAEGCSVTHVSFAPGYYFLLSSLIKCFLKKSIILSWLQQ